MLKRPSAKLTSGVTSHPFKLMATDGATPPFRASSRLLNRYKCKSLYVNQYRLYAFKVNFFGLENKVKINIENLSIYTNCCVAMMFIEGWLNRNGKKGEEGEREEKEVAESR